MSKIANIYTTEQIDIEYYNVITDMSNAIDGIPTLVIGWENAKTLFPGVDILNWKINDTTYWTFGKRERRSEYDKRLRDFYDLSIKYLSDATTYTFISLLTSSVERKRSVLSMLMDGNRKIVFKYCDMLYFCYSGGSNVYGISLRDIDYQNKDRRSILHIAKTNPSILYIEYDDCDICDEIVRKLNTKVYLFVRFFI